MNRFIVILSLITWVIICWFPEWHYIFVIKALMGSCLGYMGSLNWKYDKSVKEYHKSVDQIRYFLKDQIKVYEHLKTEVKNDQIPEEKSIR